ncbi:outer membrane protein assembly factor BamC [Hydrogenophaga sp. PBL-H3]|uniref:outer membrane protein assembly factor BamC n=1 Tax=Hydrogenophaga sp. PBL-H3 TaxID=434010 RepID=UPI00131FDA2B|nr:outer membrane protein assembly factor BamC [Hydrogenophaga sp. PBL-H3]QHE75652.1 outer membrane protein assembly factor BamC [Hydrogenophaga sp. PBL-H3]QHE80078.1 outer membrane protein assembly factor BamC [Hydrogenophaga sp. PBL-H3]
MFNSTLNQTSRPQTWVGAAAWSRLGLLTAAALIVSGCSMLQEDKIDYKSAQRGSTLDVPPDLTQLSRDSRYNVPGTTVTASGYQAAQPTQATAATTAMGKVGDVRIERAGNQRWLVIDRPADKLWSPVRDFWQENGFLLDIDQETLGIMETDWAENRAKLPQDFIRSTIGKVFENLYSTGERDRFRTRLERTANGGTEVYISHRGMVEVYSTKEKDQTVWQPRPADVELETEFLRRLMVKLGVTEAQAKAVTASAPVQAAAKVVMVNNTPVVQFEDNFDRAWRRVGLSLDRTGFTVEDRDRTKGIYFVRYVEPVTDAKEPGFFGKLFGGAKKEAATERYQVVVRSADTATTVSVLGAQGQPDSSANARRITQLLADDLK